MRHHRRLVAAIGAGAFVLIMGLVGASLADDETPTNLNAGETADFGEGTDATIEGDDATAVGAAEPFASDASTNQNQVGPAGPSGDRGGSSSAQQAGKQLPAFCIDELWIFNTNGNPEVSDGSAVQIKELVDERLRDPEGEWTQRLFDGHADCIESTKAINCPAGLKGPFEGISYAASSDAIAAEHQRYLELVFGPNREDDGASRYEPKLVPTDKPPYTPGNPANSWFAIILGETDGSAVFASADVKAWAKQLAGGGCSAEES